ncbi:hypothetical protein M430DRAFT_35736 [Amorphotheca resinae ATCC 22711]|uniref:Uncharacterized protein n=1 Tax=Amorphotheca resinae ATCC 22711 TaxID=857342 RepID=A0A2T3AXS3_AMORE|nr:hypothetical protein M430DRAFT_35736 [Amorphotheca resinae ATCC 22711]PSS14876.1 hypothetical protein M430DRAFT_35736 [Amorphotheca resinae ATCC 22711]
MQKKEKGNTLNLLQANLLNRQQTQQTQHSPLHPQLHSFPLFACLYIAIGFVSSFWDSPR